MYFVPGSYAIVLENYVNLMGISYDGLGFRGLYISMFCAVDLTIWTIILPVSLVISSRSW